MKLIPLTQGQFTKVSDCQFEYYNKWNWYARWDKDTQSYYAARHECGKTIYMAREIAKTPKGMICDHRNHDTLDNQDHNLRNVTSSQSEMNKSAQSNNKLGEKCIYPYRKGFQVCVQKDGKRVLEKFFPTLEAAKNARDEAVKKYHGEFAYIPNQD